MIRVAWNVVHTSYSQNFGFVLLCWGLFCFWQEQESFRKAIFARCGVKKTDRDEEKLLFERGYERCQKFSFGSTAQLQNEEISSVRDDDKFCVSSLEK